MPPGWTPPPPVVQVAMLSEWAWMLRFPGMRCSDVMPVLLAMRQRLLTEIDPCPARDQVQIMCDDLIAGPDRAPGLVGSPLAVPDDPGGLGGLDEDDRPGWLGDG
jgi:hypothetical protein